MRWPSPAKVNRFLHVVGRREDGMHRLQTFFQFISLEDTLALRVTTDGGITRGSGLAGVPPDADLAVRAARALREAAPGAAGVHIDIDKRIPAGGGLGGGSSNAATVLVALNHLWGLHWPLTRLAELGVRLGADVPVFVRGHAAFAEGVGEELTPVAADCPRLALVTPDCAVDTGAVFRAPELTRDSDFLTLRALFGESSSALEAATRNDCEAVTTLLYPPVAEALRLLAERFDEVRMTGTGATVFAHLDSARPAAEALRSWRDGLPATWQAFEVVTRNRSPLHETLGTLGCAECRRLAAPPITDPWGVAKR